jgi:hypothetical protein
MDTKSYIESGILERFVLGECTPAEEQEVISLKSKSPEIEQELKDIENTFEALDKAFSIDTSEKAKDNLMSSLFGSEDSTKTEPKVEEAPLGSPKKIIPFYAKPLNIAAAWTLLIISGSLNVYQFSKISQTEELLNIQFAQTNELEQNIKETKLLLAQKDEVIFNVSNTIPLLADSETKQILMKGTELNPEAQAKVFFNQKTKKAFVEFAELPELPSENQYQLWAIVEGKPVDMGVINLDTDNPAKLTEVPFIADAAAYAITIEPFGGKPTPTLEKMIVVGAV